jgi:hypothetical protein
MIKRIVPLALAAALASAATFTGVVSDSMCKRDHKAMKMGPDAECTRACIRASKEAKYVLLDGQNVYALSDPKTAEKFAAQRVTVTGTLDSKSGTLQVATIEAAR